jgi:hypothetical protein
MPDLYDPLTGRSVRFQTFVFFLPDQPHVAQFLFRSHTVFPRNLFVLCLSKQA